MHDNNKDSRAVKEEEKIKEEAIQQEVDQVMNSSQVQEELRTRKKEFAAGSALSYVRPTKDDIGVVIAYCTVALPITILAGTCLSIYSACQYLILTQDQRMANVKSQVREEWYNKIRRQHVELKIQETRGKEKAEKELSQQEYERALLEKAAKQASSIPTKLNYGTAGIIVLASSLVSSIVVYGIYSEVTPQAFAGINTQFPITISIYAAVITAVMLGAALSSRAHVFSGDFGMEGIG